MCVSSVGQVRATDGAVAVVLAGGRERAVPLLALGATARTVEPGDWLLLHTGLAVRRLDSGEAQELLAVLDDTGGGAP
jgi:hydrogenase expression/formation protein HypC